jgi:hypothetical protein
LVDDRVEVLPLENDRKREHACDGRERRSAHDDLSNLNALRLPCS